MTEQKKSQDKKLENPLPEMSLAEKFLLEKKNAQANGGNQFGNKNATFNHSGFGAKSGGGGRPIRKHAARSR